MEQSATQASIKDILFDKLGISNSSNPFICIFHTVFKGLAIFFYLFSGWALDSATVFLLVSIFSVLDFWIVKNVSGRRVNQLSCELALVVSYRRKRRGKVDV